MVAEKSLRETGEDVMRVVDVTTLYVLCVKHNNLLQLLLQRLTNCPSFLHANHITHVTQVTVIKGFAGVRKIFCCD